MQLFVPRAKAIYTPSPPPKTFNYSPQGSYDALPGPSPLIPATTVSPQQNPTSFTPQQFVDDEVIDYQPTMEERRENIFFALLLESNCLETKNSRIFQSMN